MATRTTTATLTTLALAVIGVWLWGLGAVLWTIRWHNNPLPLNPRYEAFPYGELRVGMDMSYFPFATLDAEGNVQGLDADLARAIGKEVGLPVRFVPVSFDGLIDALITDRVDVVISALVLNSASTRQVMFTTPYLETGLLLVSASSSPIKSYNDLMNRSLALELGSEADNEARKWARETDFTLLPYEYPNYALDAVRFGLADAALTDAISYQLYRRDHLFWQAHTVLVTSVPFSIAVKSDREGAHGYVDRALKRLIANRELARIVARWL